MQETRQIDDMLRDAVAAGDAAGAVALAGDASGPFYAAAVGERMLGGGVPMSLDTVFHIASMTKAVTAAAVMQLVEQGRLGLDEPLGRYVPYLAAAPVLEGFAADGTPRLRPARGEITLRRLLTHSAGFCYDFWNSEVERYDRATGTPAPRGLLEGLRQPLMFDPGTGWAYGIGIDWAGRVVEAVSGEDLNRYFARHLFAPLRMTDTTFTPSDAQAARGAGMHRWRDGRLGDAQPFRKPPAAEFFSGGAGLVATAPDYFRFLQALLAGGAGVLRPETVALMGENHLGPLAVRPLRTAHPEITRDVEFFPGIAKKWGLSFMINLAAVPGRRGAGSLGWAGLYNTFYWLDPGRGVAGLLMTQSLPFAEPAALRLFERFETAVYRVLG